MEQIVREIVRFERFALDLNRGCALIDNQIIDLRPKTFEVFRHLAANAGHLVSKDDLYDAAWPGVIVGDDSLSQCIHELRHLLGDTDRRLIQTISRRGYLLDALPVATPVAASLPIAADRPATTADGRIKAASQPHQRTWTAIAIWTAIVIAAALLLSLSDAANKTIVSVMRRATPQAENLLPLEDAKRLAALAAEKGITVPAVRFEAPADDLPDTSRRLIGVWMSDNGWSGSGRLFMVIVTRIGRGGSATGYFVNGPSTPGSRIPGPGFSTSFVGSVDGGMLHYDGTLGMHLGSLTADGRMEFKLIWPGGVTSAIVLEPFWLLPPRDRVVMTSKTGDGLKGFPDAITAVFPRAIVQTCSRRNRPSNGCRPMF